MSGSNINTAEEKTKKKDQLLSMVSRTIQQSPLTPHGLLRRMRDKKSPL